MHIFWGENPKLPSDSPKCSKHAFMVHVSPGKNVGKIHMGGVLSSVAPNLESQRLGSKFSGSKDGRPEGGDVGYGLFLLVLYVTDPGSQIFGQTPV